MALKLVSVTWGSRDPVGVAAFWAEALGWRVSLQVQDRVGLEPTDGTGFGFFFVRAEQDGVGASRMHVDLSSRSIDDQREAVARLIGLGASEVDIGQGDDAPHVVLVDPDGNEFCVLEPGNSFVTYESRVGSLTCDGTREVGYFWSEVLGWPLVWDRDEETAIRAPGDGRQFITWGGPPLSPKRVKNRLHFDLAPAPGGDQRAEVERLLFLGASLVDIGQGDVPWAVMADPDGNEFCVQGSR
ncbi:MAG TPA: VOC family protein [Acidimicrobiales bacterium]|nr:VOC family protein [Acidimicrobiales bacterium]